MTHGRAMLSETTSVDYSASPIGHDDTEALPPAIQASLTRHRENLTGMMAALEATGMGSDAVEAHLSVIIASYQTELSAALHHLGNQS